MCWQEQWARYEQNKLASMSPEGEEGQLAQGSLRQDMGNVLSIYIKASSMHGVLNFFCITSLKMINRWCLTSLASCPSYLGNSCLVNGLLLKSWLSKTHVKSTAHYCICNLQLALKPLVGGRDAEDAALWLVWCVELCSKIAWLVWYYLLVMLKCYFLSLKDKIHNSFGD